MGNEIGKTWESHLFWAVILSARTEDARGEVHGDFERGG